MRGFSPTSRLGVACVLGAAALGVLAPAALADWTRPFDLSGLLDQASQPSVGISDTGVSFFAWMRCVPERVRCQGERSRRDGGGARRDPPGPRSTRPDGQRALRSIT